MTDIKVKLLIDGIWTVIPYEELKYHTFDQCVIEEMMTKEQYDRLYFDVSTQTPST